MKSMNLFGKMTPNKGNVRSLVLNKIYDDIDIFGEPNKGCVVDADYSNSMPYTILLNTSERNYADIKRLRELIYNIEDYNMPLSYCNEHMLVRLVNNSNLGDDFVKSIESMNLTSECADIDVRSLVLEGLALQLIFTPKDMSYHYFISKIKGRYDNEPIGFIDYMPDILNSKYLEEMFNVIKSYARENNLFFTREND